LKKIPSFTAAGGCFVPGLEFISPTGLANQAECSRTDLTQIIYPAGFSDLTGFFEDDGYLHFGGAVL
jgi:hypothetical protein